jgi:hypothetical protein
MRAGRDLGTASPVHRRARGPGAPWHAARAIRAVSDGKVTLGIGGREGWHLAIDAHETRTTPGHHTSPCRTAPAGSQATLEVLAICATARHRRRGRRRTRLGRCRVRRWTCAAGCGRVASQRCPGGQASGRAGGTVRPRRARVRRPQVCTVSVDVFDRHVRWRVRLLDPRRRRRATGGRRALHRSPSPCQAMIFHALPIKVAPCGPLDRAGSAGGGGAPAWGSAAPPRVGAASGWSSGSAVGTVLSPLRE